MSFCQNNVIIECEAIRLKNDWVENWVRFSQVNTCDRHSTIQYHTLGIYRFGGNMIFYARLTLLPRHRKNRKSENEFVKIGMTRAIFSQFVHRFVVIVRLVFGFILILWSNFSIQNSENYVSETHTWIRGHFWQLWAMINFNTHFTHICLVSFPLSWVTIREKSI